MGNVAQWSIGLNANAFVPVLSPQVGATDIVVLDMSQLAFDGVRMPFTRPVNQRARHCAKAMSRHLAACVV